MGQFNKHDWTNEIKKVTRRTIDVRASYVERLAHMKRTGRLNLNIPPTENEQLILHTTMFIINVLQKDKNITQKLITQAINRVLHQLYGEFDFDAFVDCVNNVFGKRSENNGKE